MSEPEPLIRVMALHSLGRSELWLGGEHLGKESKHLFSSSAVDFAQTLNQPAFVHGADLIQDDLARLLWNLTGTRVG